MIAFGLGLAAATTLIVGLLPALRATRMNPASVLEGDGRRTSAAPTSLARRLLIAVDLALAVLTVVVRTGGDAGGVAADVRRAIAAAATDVPVFGVAPLSDLVARSVGPRRFVMVLLELFGGVALLLTAIGIYSVLSSNVSERTREIGVRSALGATRADVARLVLGSGMTTVLTGVVAGCVLALGLTRFLQASLFGVSPDDPMTFAIVTLTLLTVAFVAPGSGAPSCTSRCESIQPRRCVTSTAVGSVRGAAWGSAKLRCATRLSTRLSSAVNADDKLSTGCGDARTIRVHSKYARNFRRR